MDNIAAVVLGIGAADRLPLHAAELVDEIEVVGPGEIVVVFFVVKGPVVRVGHGRRRAPCPRARPADSTAFRFARLVVALFAAIERAVVVFVPVLGRGRRWRRSRCGVNGTMAQSSPTSWLQAATTPGALITSSTSGMSSGVTRSPVPTACFSR